MNFLQAARHRLAVVAALAALALSGTVACNESNVCGQTEENVLRADGGEYRCTQPEDCPRSSDVFVCETDTSAEKACVSCEDTRCVRTVPIACGVPQ